MTASTDFRALLAAHAPLVDLVGDRVAQNALGEGVAYPAIVYTISTSYERGLDGTLLGTTHSINVNCWANSPDSAEEVADAVDAALQAANPAYDILVTDRASDFEPDLGLDFVQQSVEWIVT